MKSPFQIDINNLKISNLKTTGPAEDAVSKTIEELLELNKLIPKRRKEESMSLTETQFDNREYRNKPSRGERKEITERQFDDNRDADEKANVAEELFENAPKTKGGHHGEEEIIDLKARGHDQVPPIWMEVYKKEDKRKKLDNRKLDKKLKSDSQ